MRSSNLARIPGFRQRIIPEPRVPSRGSQARGTRLDTTKLCGLIIGCVFIRYYHNLIGVSYLCRLKLASSAGNSCGISNDKLLKNPIKNEQHAYTVANSELIIFNLKMWFRPSSNKTRHSSTMRCPLSVVSEQNFVKTVACCMKCFYPRLVIFSCKRR